MKSAFCALASLVLLSACMGGGSGPAHSAEYAPSFAPSAPPQQQVANGAIYQASYGYAPLTSGARASMVGDILTIALVERTQASKSNSATTDRAGKIGLSHPATGPWSLFSSRDVNMGGDKDFTGKGRSDEHKSELK